MIVADIYRTTRRTTRPGRSGRWAPWTADAIKNRYVGENPGPLSAGMKQKPFGCFEAAGQAFAAATGAARADGDAMRGEKKFEECAPCHKLERTNDGLGPNLHGLFGRKAASLDRFAIHGAARNGRHHLDAAVA